jgi:hypothetical protein
MGGIHVEDAGGDEQQQRRSAALQGSGIRCYFDVCDVNTEMGF